jgi:hypothetical protein
MINVLPTQGRTLVLVAEWIRQELGGKTSLIGMYSDGIVVFLNRVTFPVILPIGICYIFRDGSGKFQCGIRIASPTGQVILDNPIGEITKQSELSHTMIVQIPAFQIIELGEYDVEMILDGTRYPSKITFRQG